MTDLELLDRYCDKCLNFIDPFVFNDIRSRGLTWCILSLPTDKNQAKAVVRGRLSKVGRYAGDPEIEQIADWVARLEKLRADLLRLNMADSHQVALVLAEMVILTSRLADYYR
jgi:hypothetical protein